MVNLRVTRKNVESSGRTGGSETRRRQLPASVIAASRKKPLQLTQAEWLSVSSEVPSVALKTAELITGRFL